MEAECADLSTAKETLTQDYSGRRQFDGLTTPPATACPWPSRAGQHAKPVRVLLVDPDASIRCVIAQELLCDIRIQLDGQASTVREGRRLLREHEFDVLVVDVCMGDGSGFELIEEARKHRSAPEVIAISAREDESQTLRALELGASGYLAKNAWLQSYAHAVLHVVNGGAVVTATMIRQLLPRLHHPHPHPHPPSAAAAVRPLASDESLSPRERQVLRLVAIGNVSADIAAQLTISPQTVHAHIKSIHRKLHVHTRAQAVNFATQKGLL
ncbi:DNA-binding NarL/FixJ family response regulator [Variovorax sp. W1I1]|uniref:LuxR C-terminal-related transcriptional regulator n=1 Tax=Variovorax sp. W1I1 TaxID=3042309 RepID=UPI002785DCAB|nr:response regulator transcription factor [Variovorax sp. W1I1]MDQ0608134.1 DNA-binding NarL/FixJ family response regulator [Variovorax sp. W1I1]